MKNEYEVRGDVTAIFIKCHGRIFETIIDTCDLPLVKSYPTRWYGYLHRDRVYVVGNINKGNEKSRQLHRLLVGDPKGLVIDHINHDTLDNRRSVNLRVVTNGENLQNLKIKKNNTSGHRGVDCVKTKTTCVRWRARVKINGRVIQKNCLSKEEAIALTIEWRSKYMPYSQEAMQLKSVVTTK